MKRLIWPISLCRLLLLCGSFLLTVCECRAESRRDTQSKNNLKQIMLALHNHHDAHGSFPAGTHPNSQLEVEKRFSWQAEVLPFLDQVALHRQLNFDKAWDDEVNADATDVTITIFQNPQNPQMSPSGGNQTHYVGLAGLGEEGPTLPVTDKRAGVFGYDRVTRFSDITDGMSNTIALSEANANLGPWAQGGPSTVRPLTKTPYINGPDGLGGNFRGGCHMALCDGSVRFISQNIDPSVLEKAVTIAGGEPASAFPAVENDSIHFMLHGYSVPKLILIPIVLLIVIAGLFLWIKSRPKEK